jgi:UDP-N-acetylmuramyl pentapeptide phosphotransferase/UDP-N-acetylglucosamine-1-phosphate transferase
MTSISNQPTLARALAYEQGQSSTEYLVVCAALALALGVGMVDDSSALRQLLNAFVLSYQKISFAISLP